MRTFTRRKVLTDIAKLSSLAAVAPTILACKKIPDRRVMLNVVFHGLFVFNIDDLCIEVLTPVVQEHIYRAGGWDIGNVCDLQPNAEYGLRGVRGEAQAPVIDAKGTRIFCQSSDGFRIDSTKSQYRLVLPFPASFQLLRCTRPLPPTPTPPAKIDARKTPYYGYDCDSLYPPTTPTPSHTPSPYPTPTPPKDIPVTQISLCQALTYYVSDYRALKLVGTYWNPDVTSGCAVNLHFWAEPEMRLTESHACNAYAKLNDLIPPLRLHLKVTETPPLDRDTGVCGLPPEQEQGWSDWRSGGGEGVWPTNCCAMIARKG